MFGIIKECIFPHWKCIVQPILSYKDIIKSEIAANKYLLKSQSYSLFEKVDYLEKKMNVLACAVTYFLFLVTMQGVNVRFH